MTAAVQPVPAVGVNPYPGLRPFEASESSLFFGREKQIQELMSLLLKARFLAVVGSSGSGKSSLVRAGLIPSLQAASAWRTAVLRPGDKPIENLAIALYNDAQIGKTGAAPAIELGLVETTLRSSSIGLSAVVQQSRLPATEKLLVVVDQFEELFRYRSSDQADYAETSSAFVKLLLSAAADPLGLVHVVITMRADFLGNCAPYPSLPKAVSDGQFLVPYLSRQELRRAITEPAAFVQCEIAPRLVVRLLNEAGEDPDQLPVLQHALMRCWDYWQRDHAVGEPLDFRHYEAIGTMRTALSQHADEAFSELDSAAEKRIAEQAFRALVETDQQSRVIRRPTTIAEIAAITGAEKSIVGTVLDHFRNPSRAFVVLRSDCFLDLSHESLIRVWTRLAGWAAAEAQAARLYLRLAASAKLNQEGSESLWVNPQLALAQKWRSETKPTPAWAQRYAPDLDLALTFLEASRKAANRMTMLRIAAVNCFIAVLLFAVVVTYVDNQRLKGSLNSIKRSNSQLNDQIGTFKKAQTEAADEVSSLRAKQASLTNDVSNLTAETSSLVAEVKSLHQESDSLTLQEHEATEERDAALSKLVEAISTNDTNVESVSDLAGQNASWLAKVKTLNAENRTLMTKIIELGLKMPVIGPMRLVSAVGARSPMMVASAAAPLFKVASDTYLQQLLDENNKLLAEASRLNDANQKLAAQVAALRQQNERLRDLKADLREQVTKLNAEVKLLSSVNTLRSQQIADLQTTSEKLATESSAVNSESLALGTVETSLKGGIDDMSIQVQLLNQINAALSKAIQTAQPKN